MLLFINNEASFSMSSDPLKDQRKKRLTASPSRKKSQRRGSQIRRKRLSVGRAMRMAAGQPMVNNKFGFYGTPRPDNKSNIFWWIQNAEILNKNQRLKKNQQQRKAQKKDHSH
ncbi:hypothetical protein ACQZV8_01810 [Magnetococcales bacterium HHB-1]